MGTFGWRGLQESTAHTPALALGIAELQERGRHMRALEADSASRIAIEQDKANRENIAFDYQHKKLQEQERVAKAYTSLSMVAPGLLENPRLKKQMVEAARSAGYDIRETEDDVFAPNEAFAHVSNLLKTKREFHELALSNAYADLEEKNAGIVREISELTKDGKVDEKKVAPLKARQQAIKKQMAEIISGQAEFKKAQMLAESKPQKVQFQDLGDKSVVWVDGKPVAVTPKGQRPGTADRGGGTGGGGGEGTGEERKGRLTEQSVVNRLAEQYPSKSNFQKAYSAYLQYKKDGYNRETSFDYTMKFMAGNVVGGKPQTTATPTSQPAWKKYE